MADIKVAFGSSAVMTITLASLANAAARESLVVDNSSNKFLDALLQISIKTGVVSGDKQILIWLYGSEDGSNFDDNASGADAAITLRNPNNFKGCFVINCPTDSLTYKVVIPVASFFGNILPRKWGVIVENKTGSAFSATPGDHAVKYSGVYQTIY